MSERERNERSLKTDNMCNLLPSKYLIFLQMFNVDLLKTKERTINLKNVS